jgi:hypothetical protein
MCVVDRLLCRVVRAGLLKESHVAEPKRRITLLQRREGKLGAGLGKTTGMKRKA